MVEIKSPLTIKEIEGKLGVVFRWLNITGKGARRELFDSEKLVTLKLKKGERIILMTGDHRIYELGRGKKRGYYNVRDLTSTLEINYGKAKRVPKSANWT